MDDDLGELIKVSEEIAGSAEIVGIDSTPLVQFLDKAEDVYNGTGSAMPVADPLLAIWLTRVKLALAERTKGDSALTPATAPDTFEWSPSAPQQIAPTPSPVSLPSPLPSPPPPSPSPPPCPFEFSDSSKKPVVNGVERDFLTPAQHAVLTALKKAGASGLSKDQLDTKSGHNEARKILKDLAKKDPEWRDVILFPEKPGRGYKLQFS